ncbi:MAG: undecaprenyl-diphosphate phosphatase [Synechococcaceae cyanobacterium]|nr:undecaprenyl-diphosphate phosphatase [Synechococcaceae cyanobacterium]
MTLLASATTTAAAPLGLLQACWHAFVLGVIQGLTEFLPISSTAHLKVVPVLLGWGDPGVAVTAVIQLGSIAAVLAYFRADLLEVIRGTARAFRHGQWRDPAAQLGLAIAVGTVPIVIGGLAIKKLVPDYDNSPMRSLVSIGVVSIVMALLLALAELLGRRRRVLEQVRVRDGLLVGLAQALALVPGVSRSGSTLTASLFDGWQRGDAARFSFLLGIPAITLAGLVELKGALAADGAGGGPVPMLVGVLSAAVVSWLAIAWLLRFLQRHSTWVFVGYRLLFGLAILIWFRHLESPLA